MPYHHGNLRQALTDAAVALARGGGPDAVVLRAVTREAGVSPNAAYRHFSDRDDLLAAVRDYGMGELASRMRRGLAEAGGDDGSAERAWERLRATGRAYVDFALAEPGLFRTAFSTYQLPPSPDDAGAAPYEILSGCIDALVRSGAVPPQRRPLAETAAWAAVHGISELLLFGPLRALGPGQREAAIERVLDTVGFGL